MRVVSTELRQVFKAYTKQLRHAPAKDGKERSSSVLYRKGYEKVELSDEARQLASESAEESGQGAEEPEAQGE